MIFLTYWFYVFAAAALITYWAVPHRYIRLVLLLAACVTFHAHFAGAAGVVPIIVLAVLTYLAGLARLPIFCFLGIAASGSALVFYKYSGFICLHIIGALSPMTGDVAFAWTHRWLPAAPPLAISFFAFEFIHYLYDVRRGSPTIKNPLHFANFAVFWPSIVAGPVKRYEQFVPSMLEGARHVPLDDVSYGCARVVVGFLKKAIADNLTAFIAFANPLLPQWSIPVRWGVLGCLGLRILFDFSGYSDMAIGFARMLGIRLPENFNWPYFSTSIVDFWHRWHISLSSWIRDYIYIPMGGSRRGLARKILNGLFAFALCGLWHGAAWNFVLWGIYHGIGLAVASNYRAIGPVGRGIGNMMSRAPWLGWPPTLLFVSLGWLLFFYPMPEAAHFFALLFRP